MKTIHLIVFGTIIALGALIFTTPVLAWNLEGSCAGLPTEVNIGETVIWTANQTSTAIPGDGTFYTWQWSGDESLSGITQSISKTYTTAGVKNASVKISLIITPSNIETITRTCSITVKTPPPPINPPPENPPPSEPPVNPPPENPPPSNPPPSGCQSNCGGGGLNQPTVVLLQKAVKAPLAFIYLSQIPYTGLSGAGKILLFLLGLAIWSALVVYALRSQKIAGVAERLVSNIRTRFSSTPNTIFQPDEKSANAFEVTNDLLLNTQLLNPTSAQNSELESLLAVEAKKERTLISPDGLKTVIEMAATKGEEPLATLGKMIENAKNKFSREDGWLLLNKEKILVSLTAANVVVPAYGTPEKITANIPEIPVRVPEAHSVTDQKTEINTFVSLLARGDEKAVTNYLRTLREGGKSLERFIRETIIELDGAYRARLEGENNKSNFV
ncbi:MAG TPA: hypothetical protein VJC04_02010, partial [Candidatus Paceibacterota bacterium]